MTHLIKISEDAFTAESSKQIAVCLTTMRVYLWPSSHTRNKPSFRYVDGFVSGKLWLVFWLSVIV